MIDLLEYCRGPGQFNVKIGRDRDFLLLEADGGVRAFRTDTHCGRHWVAMQLERY